MEINDFEFQLQSVINDYSQYSLGILSELNGNHFKDKKTKVLLHGLKRFRAFTLSISNSLCKEPLTFRETAFILLRVLLEDSQIAFLLILEEGDSALKKVQQNTLAKLNRMAEKSLGLNHAYFNSEGKGMLKGKDLGKLKDIWREEGSDLLTDQKKFVVPSLDIEGELIEIVKKSNNPEIKIILNTISLKTYFSCYVHDMNFGLSNETKDEVKNQELGMIRESMLLLHAYLNSVVIYLIARENIPSIKLPPEHLKHWLKNTDLP